jgi:hypothetical protein
MCALGSRMRVLRLGMTRTQLDSRVASWVRGLGVEWSVV